MAFEVFKRRSRAISTKPVIAIQNRGTVSLNAAAHALFTTIRKHTEGDLYIQFLYDAEHKLVGFRPVAPETKDSYPVRKQPQSESYLVTGRGFFSYNGIPTDGVRRYAARILEDDIVGFGLEEDELK